MSAYKHRLGLTDWVIMQKIFWNSCLKLVNAAKAQEAAVAAVIVLRLLKTQLYFSSHQQGSTVLGLNESHQISAHVYAVNLMGKKCNKNANLSAVVAQQNQE